MTTRLDQSNGASATDGRDCSRPLTSDLAAAKATEPLFQEFTPNPASMIGTGFGGIPPLKLQPNADRRIRPEVFRCRERIPRPIIEAIQACATGENPWPLLISGTAGCGKTLACLYLADRVRGDVRWRDISELLSEFVDLKMGRLPANCRTDVPMTARDYWGEWRDWFSLAIIDEVGACGKVTDTAHEAFKGVLDAREGLPLALVSNLDPEGIKRLFNDRIASRIAAGTVCVLEGTDQQITPSVHEVPGGR